MSLKTFIKPFPLKYIIVIIITMDHFSIFIYLDEIFKIKFFYLRLMMMLNALKRFICEFFFENGVINVFKDISRHLVLFSMLSMCAP